jgi:hypothetical protein
MTPDPNSRESGATPRLHVRQHGRTLRYDIALPHPRKLFINNISATADEPYILGLKVVHRSSRDAPAQMLESRLRLKFAESPGECRREGEQ